MIKILLTILILFSFSLTATDKGDELKKKKRAIIEKRKKERADKLAKTDKAAADRLRKHQADIANKRKEIALAKKNADAKKAKANKKTLTQAELKQMKLLKDEAYHVKKDIDSKIDILLASSLKFSQAQWNLALGQQNKIDFRTGRKKSEHEEKWNKTVKLNLISMNQNHLNATVKVKEYETLLFKYLEIKKATGAERAKPLNICKAIRKKIDGGKRFAGRIRERDLNYYKSHDRYYRAKYVTLTYNKDMDNYQARKLKEFLKNQKK
jgi:hypothetical protein